MYAWQTLALARTEFKSRDFLAGTQRIKESVRNLLYMIGQPHFPDPQISLGEQGGIELQWDVDGRTLMFTVRPVGEIDYCKFGPGESRTDDCGGVDPGDCEQVWGLVEWLLFGTCPPK